MWNSKATLHLRKLTGKDAWQEAFSKLLIKMPAVAKKNREFDSQEPENGS